MKRSSQVWLHGFEFHFRLLAGESAVQWRLAHCRRTLTNSLPLIAAPHCIAQRVDESGLLYAPPQKKQKTKRQAVPGWFSLCICSSDLRCGAFVCWNTCPLHGRPHSAAQVKSSWSCGSFSPFLSTHHPLNRSCTRQTVVNTKEKMQKGNFETITMDKSSTARNSRFSR